MMLFKMIGFVMTTYVCFEQIMASFDEVREDLNVLAKLTVGMKLVNASSNIEGENRITVKKSTGCIHMCLLEYRRSGRCLSVNYHGITGDCVLNDLHVRDDDKNILLQPDNPWKWIDLKFGPPSPPRLNVTGISQENITLTWSAGYNGGFEQLFKIEYRKDSDQAFTLLDQELSDSGEDVQVDDMISDLIAGTTYLIRITAANYRPLGVNATYTEVTVTTKNASSCSDYKKDGFLSSDDYVIDPDGDSGVDPFTVFCNMSAEPVEAVFYHDKADRITLKSGTQDPRLVFTVTYLATIEQISVVADAATRCRQYFKRECHKSFGTNHTAGHMMSYWFGRSNTLRQNYADDEAVACWCQKTGTCENPLPCNCDSNIDTWLVDEGYIMLKDHLPVVQFYQGDINSNQEITKITLGPLICTN